MESKTIQTLAEVIDVEHQNLNDRFPGFEPNIELYRTQMAILINSVIETHGTQDSKKLFEALCPYVEQANDKNLFMLPPEAIQYLNMLKGLIREQVEKGNVKVGKVPLGGKPELLIIDEPAFSECEKK